jgi:hypothetical protein
VFGQYATPFTNSPTVSKEAMKSTQKNEQTTPETVHGYIKAKDKEKIQNRLSAPFLKDGKQRNAADAFGASALGPTPTASLCS